jgi:hypothetical protein
MWEYKDRSRLIIYFEDGESMASMDSGLTLMKFRKQKRISDLAKFFKLNNNEFERWSFEGITKDENYTLLKQIIVERFFNQTWICQYGFRLAEDGHTIEDNLFDFEKETEEMKEGTRVFVSRYI